MKSFLKLVVQKSLFLLSSSKLGRFIHASMLEQAMEKTENISHGLVVMTLCTPNPLTKWRAQTFSEKEPETLEWIDGMDSSDVLWDVGANIGLYSIYAAKKHGMTVYSFEPSIFNLELLGRNCAVNKVNEQVTIMPMALSKTSEKNLMQHSNTTWGGALSSFGVNYGFDGKKVNEKISYQLVGFSADDLVKFKIAPPPTCMKIDVDGIEHLILSGALGTLETVRTVLVEINEDFTEQFAMVKKILLAKGFRLCPEKKDKGSNLNSLEKTYNQIWKKNAN